MFYTAAVRPTYREEPCSSALNRVSGMPFRWTLNPYMGCAHRCTFCYVRAFERRAERPSGEGYGNSIRVKVNVAEVLAVELRRRAWLGEEVLIGSATDPYQPAEGRYRLTRACIEVLARAANPVALITRSPLVVRDIDVLGVAASRAPLTVTFSVPTLDEQVWRRSEPSTAPPRQRLEALRRLVEAGIRTSVAMAPILPGLSDSAEGLAAVVAAAREAGACGVWAAPLRLAPGTREHFLEQLAQAWPELLPDYERLFAGRASLPSSLSSPLRERVAALARAHGIADRRPPAPRPPEPPLQLALDL